MEQTLTEFIAGQILLWLGIFVAIIAIVQFFCDKKSFHWVMGFNILAATVTSAGYCAYWQMPLTLFTVHIPTGLISISFSSLLLATMVLDDYAGRIRPQSSKRKAGSKEYALFVD